MNWSEIAKRLLLDDGRITERETELLRRAVFADNVVDREEVAFLVDLKRSATTVHPEFDRFLFDVLQRIVLADGAISDNEARWLRQMLFADQQVTPTEVEFIERLHREAQSFGAEFESLYKDCTQLRESMIYRG